MYVEVNILGKIPVNFSPTKLPPFATWISPVV